MWRALLVASCLVSCVEPSVVNCDDGSICPAGKACDTTHHLCVVQAQLDACTGKADQDGCDFAPNSVCHEGTCLPVACGNERMDPGEVCDDGNQANDDDCSADCLSTLACGNHTTDISEGESCDDGNRVDHDGCSSACQTELPRWVEVTGPAARYGASAAYDATRDTVVMNGGAGLNNFNDTWEWRGRWTQPPVVTPPELASDAPTAFDPDRHAVIRVGGAGSAPSNKVYEWDGRAWTRLAGNAPAVYAHSMAYDSGRHRMVVFGGRTTYDGSLPPTNATWEWDGTTWTQITPAHSPPARAYASMTYDPERGKILLYGGKADDSTGTPFSDTWTYDGIDWTQVGSSSPPGRFGAALAYDPAIHADVLFGGFTTSSYMGSGTPTTQTWVWNGAWSQLTPASSPSARGGGSLTLDGRGNLLLFGGTNNFYMVGTPTADTWLFNGTTWSQTTLPTPVYDFAVATDSDRHQQVVFAGHTSASFLRDTWELTQTRWTKTPTSGTTATNDPPGMTYDVKRHELVLFGGSASSTASNETWIWNGSAWAQRTPTTSPPGRARGQLAYDSDHGVVLAFACAGTNAATASDLWAWDGTTWTELHPAHTPPPRSYESVAYDPVHHQLVVFGGLAPLTGFIRPVLADTWVYENDDWKQMMPPAPDADYPAGIEAPFTWNPARGMLTLVESGTLNVWEWNGTWWQRVVPDSATPPLRVQFGIVPSLDNNGLELLYGSSNGTVFNDVWQLRWDGPRASDVCGAAIERDGDMLVGCDDPDCWVTCTPECAPNASCPAGSPRCGDGACDPIAESCYTCPDDCTCAAVCGNFTCDAGETATSCPGDCP